MLIGALLVVTATLGDLIESLIKRDLGIKDMGTLLPGHGGLMDRLDSLLPTALVAWAVLSLLVSACDATRARIPSPNIWHWPEVYEQENAAQDVEGAVWAALRDEAPWTGRDVVDVGCGDGFHLRFFDGARSVLGVEPYAPLVERAQADGLAGGARARPRGSRCPTRRVDLVHARTAYFFGKGCEPGLAEAWRVLRPGGALAIVDLDATVPPYGDWMRADIPHYDPVAAERFFTATGLLAAPDPDDVALPRPRDLRGRAAHRVLARRGRPRARAVHRADDPGRLPAARAAQAAHPIARRRHRVTPPGEGSHAPLATVAGMRSSVCPSSNRSSAGCGGPSAPSRCRPGLGTVVLAAGIGVTGGLIVALRRRHGSGEPLPPGGRGRLLRIAFVVVVLAAAAGPLLGLVGLGELAVPVACAVTGFALFPLASLLDERALLAAGGLLLVLAATGALFALDSAGTLLPQGLVGMAAGVVLWLVGAQRSGLLAEARTRAPLTGTPSLTGSRVRG